MERAKETDREVGVEYLCIYRHTVYKVSKVNMHPLTIDRRVTNGKTNNKQLHMHLGTDSTSLLKVYWREKRHVFGTKR